MTTNLQEPAFAAFIGIDWGDKKHDVCLTPAGREAPEQRERSVLEHDPSQIAAWASRLKRRFKGGPIAVCLELSRGPLVSALLEHDIFVVFPVNPQSLAKYRQTFAPSGAKDDPSDAEFALDFLVRHRDRLRPLKLESTTLRMVREMVVSRRSLVHERVRVTNRLIHALKAYFPQVLDWFEDRSTEVFAAFLAHWPSLQAAKRARRPILEEFFRNHNVRYQAVVQRRIEAIKNAVPLTSDDAVIMANELLVMVLVRQLRALSQGIKDFDDVIAKLVAEHEDYHLFADLPGAGAVYAPRLLAAFGEDRQRFESARDVQCATGIAPVLERSGNSAWTHHRFRCHKFTKQTFVEWAAQTIPKSFWARAYYDQQ
ncbi:MAG: IS110 family transposase, partial [Myxococcales bacterium]|nr:IS110 family transposase [Myxococcales bacterium]